MDATLHALGEILLKALPTFFLVTLLFVYLKIMFFRPLEKVLKARYDAESGTSCGQNGGVRSRPTGRTR
jgi:hypothetical protein